MADATTSGDLRAHFDQRAATYGGAAPWVNDPASLLPIAEVVSRHDPGFVLDLGAGSGAVPSFLATRGLLPRTYVCLDLSYLMLAHVDKATPVLGDAKAIPLATDSVDLALCRQAFHYFADPVAVLDDIARVLKQGSPLVLAQITPYEDPEDQRWWSSAVFMRQPLRRHAWTEESITRSLARAGFTCERSQLVDRRSSLLSWLDRYPIEPVRRDALQQHFRGAPKAIQARRGFLVSEDDVEFSIRWTVLEAFKESEGHEAQGVVLPASVLRDDERL